VDVAAEVGGVVEEVTVAPTVVPSTLFTEEVREEGAESCWPPVLDD
jgi:hypothetical protein